MQKQKVLETYCSGCGLCKSELDIELVQDEKGFMHPRYDSKDVDVKLMDICPASGKALDKLDTSQMWGRHINVYQAYSSNSEIRKKASSGGVLTSLAIYLLESNKVDGIIHSGKVDNHPFKTKSYCSTSRTELISRCGSRYAISAPLIDLDKLVEPEKKYCFIGKPCDVVALRNYIQSTGKYSNIIYTFSFFCAGMPSANANQKLLKELGCSEENCKSLNYRGNGWPGKATAVDSYGNVKTMSYSESWGGILGRDINKYCRLCMDGIGEMADVACGDGWYIKDGSPDFTETDGRNIVFTRTENGQKLFQEACDAGAIIADKWDNLDEVKLIQKYQYTRKANMLALYNTMKYMGRCVPHYSRDVLKAYDKYADKKGKRKIVLGTIKRILKGRM